jgi:hypothetical protein
MGSRYAFIVLYVLLERYMSRGDYLRPGLDPDSAGGGRRFRPGRRHDRARTLEGSLARRSRDEH